MPDPIQNAYTQALVEARKRGLSVGRTGLERLRRSFAAALQAITRDVAEGRITAERGKALRAQAIRALSDFETAFAQLTEASARVTAQQVTEIHRSVVRSLGEQHGLPNLAAGAVGAEFDVIPTKVVGSILARSGNAATFRTVLRRRLTDVVPQIDSFIESAVSRGVATGRATYDLASILANGDPDVMAMLPAGLRSRLHRGVGQIDFSVYGLTEAQVSAARSLLYDARRIMVSETNNAMREAGARAAVASPIIEAAKWQTSGRHSHTDACDALAEINLYGYGPGQHPVDAWPFAPHPHCACSQGGPIVYRPVREWNKPKGPGRPLQADPADASLYSRWAKDVTPAELDRIRASASASVKNAGLGRAVEPIASASAAKAVAQGATPLAPSFRPASTIAEAEAYAREHLAGVVSYAGLDLRTANRINLTLTEEKRVWGVKGQLSRIEPSTRMRAHAKSGTDGSIVFNPRKVMAHDGENARLASRYATAGPGQPRRYYADDSVEGLFRHEFSHQIHNLTQGGITLRLDGVYRRLTKEDRLAFRERFSEYGLSSPDEFFPEAYTLWRRSPGDLPREMREFFEQATGGRVP